MKIVIICLSFFSFNTFALQEAIVTPLGTSSIDTAGENFEVDRNINIPREPIFDHNEDIEVAKHWYNEEISLVNDVYWDMPWYDQPSIAKANSGTMKILVEKAIFDYFDTYVIPSKYNSIRGKLVDSSQRLHHQSGYCADTSNNPDLLVEFNKNKASLLTNDFEARLAYRNHSLLFLHSATQIPIDLVLHQSPANNSSDCDNATFIMFNKAGVTDVKMKSP